MPFKPFTKKKSKETPAEGNKAAKVPPFLAKKMGKAPPPAVKPSKKSASKKKDC